MGETRGMRNSSEKSVIYRDKIKGMGYELLNEYIDSVTKVKVMCPNGHIRECRFSTLKKYSCRECVNEDKLVKLIAKVEGRGYTLLKYPDDARDVIIAECDKGHIRKAKIHNFLNHSCAECNGGHNIQKTINECREAFEKQGFTLLEDEYINCKTKMKYMCTCGEIRYTNLDTIMNRKITSCNMCKGRKFSGELHHNWRGGITPEMTRIRNSQEIRDWRFSVFLRDNFTCQKCHRKENILNAHHIYNFSTHEHLRADINNGITLCQECHITGPESFHSIYGTRENNLEQLEEFLGRRLDFPPRCKETKTND